MNKQVTYISYLNPKTSTGVWQKGAHLTFCFGEDAERLTWPPYYQGKKIFPFKTNNNQLTVTVVTRNNDNGENSHLCI